MSTGCCYTSRSVAWGGVVGIIVAVGIDIMSIIAFGLCHNLGASFLSCISRLLQNRLRDIVFGGLKEGRKRRFVYLGAAGSKRESSLRLWFVTLTRLPVSGNRFPARAAEVIGRLTSHHVFRLLLLLATSRNLRSLLCALFRVAKHTYAPAPARFSSEQSHSIGDLTFDTEARRLAHQPCAEIGNRLVSLDSRSFMRMGVLRWWRGVICKVESDQEGQAWGKNQHKNRSSTTRYHQLSNDSVVSYRLPSNPRISWIYIVIRSY